MHVCNQKTHKTKWKWGIQKNQKHIYVHCTNVHSVCCHSSWGKTTEIVKLDMSHINVYFISRLAINNHWPTTSLMAPQKKKVNMLWNNMNDSLVARRSTMKIDRISFNYEMDPLLKWVVAAAVALNEKWSSKMDHIDDEREKFNAHRMSVGCAHGRWKR